ncbi:A-type ATP synthase subunit A [Ferroplasma acidiphilum]|uniref:A-type ATP synthase subunit A n=1 Tax=Ferroplasma acidiphilum TaxID=74969 RepID=A0A1V0N678_9ARCH|nr:V-type ATP synthase subunit A [Ferroplasma acidiphilum]ARD85660.1 A-type ATP synthase subunit A [Ferroplasma acidiphilum]
MENKGSIYSISGPVVIATDLDGKMFDVVRVGEMGLVGEVIKIVGDKFTIQVYEDTSGLKPGEPVYSTGKPLSVELGPGLLKSIYDGIQRPLDIIQSETGDFIVRGATAPPLDEKKEWDFVPLLKEGDEVEQGYILGTVQETNIITHKIMVPYGIRGIIKSISKGKFKVSDTVCIIDTGTSKYDIKLKQIWPVRQARKVFLKFAPEIPLITGQRVIDSFFPVAKGGTVAVPGPFGSGKTVIQHQLSKWSDADITVYVGCGERGNEMTEILSTFPELQDPKSGKPLMEKTILIANTSNMPVAAREASIYTGVTIAEYYRDMGYDVALMADSTSRWAEALREISGRLEEMPGEEGYPAYLGRRISEFYERSGNAQIIAQDERTGSITLIGAVSPPGGDLSDPVVQNTLRVTRAFWALDASLASRRHFPSINWLNSYSLYLDSLSGWFKSNVNPEWPQMHSLMMGILQKESELQEIVQLVGYDSLPENQKNVLDIAKIIREDFLQQNAFDDTDTYCSIKKQYEMLTIIKTLNEMQEKSIASGLKLTQTATLPVRMKISRMKEIPENDFEKFYNDVIKEINNEYDNIMEGVESV